MSGGEGEDLYTSLSLPLSPEPLPSLSPSLSLSLSLFLSESLVPVEEEEDGPLLFGGDSSADSREGDTPSRDTDRGVGLTVASHTEGEGEGGDLDRGRI